MTQLPTSYTLKRDTITDCFVSMDWQKLKKALDNVPTNNLDIDRLCRWIIRTENIVCKHHNAEREKKRSILFSALESFVLKRMNSSAANKLTNINDLILQLEDGYRRIWKERLSGEKAKLSAEQRVSGTLKTACSIIHRMQKISDDYFKKANSVSNVMVLTDEEGNEVNPDAEITAICDVAAMTCLAEGFANNWFDNKGVLILPSLPSLSHEEQKVSEKVSVNALFWRNWQSVDEHRRFLGGNIKTYKKPNLPKWVGESKKIEVALEYHPPHDKIERLDSIANDRWKRQLLQNFMQMLGQTKLQDQATGLTKPLTLKLGDFVSENEGLTRIALCETVYHHINNSPIKYHGLRLVEWVRGFAILQQYILDNFEKSKPETLLPCNAYEDWIELLTTYGLNKNASKIFIRHVRFKRSSRDLYDAPFLTLADNTLCLFGPAMNSANLVEVVLSALNRLGTQYDEKGYDFETYMLNFLNKQDGVEAKTKTVTRNGEEFQYDILMKFDNMIFHFEQKNCSLSKGIPQRIYYDYKRVKKHVKQTTRLANALDENPEILNDLFGQGSSELPRVDAVLYARPYSIPGGIHDIFVYDAPSLCRFFNERHLNSTSQHKIGNTKFVMPIPVTDFWGQDTPTAAMLAEQVIHPFQVDLAWSHLTVGYVASTLSATHVGLRIEHQHKQMTSESIATHFGADIDEITKTQEKFSQDIITARNTIRNTTISGDGSKQPLA